MNRRFFLFTLPLFALFKHKPENKVITANRLHHKDMTDAWMPSWNFKTRHEPVSLQDVLKKEPVIIVSGPDFRVPISYK